MLPATLASPCWVSVALGATPAFCQEVLFPWLCIAHPSPHCPTDVYLSSKLISTWDLAFSRVPEGGNAASVRSRASPQTLDSTVLALSSFHGTMCAPTPVPASQAFSTIQHSHCKTSPQIQGVGPCGYSLCVGTPQPLLYFLLLRRPEGATGQVGSDVAAVYCELCQRRRWASVQNVTSSLRFLPHSEPLAQLHQPRKHLSLFSIRFLLINRFSINLLS